MPYETILYEKKGPVLTLTLNRPESLNAINPQMTEELHTALDDADADREIRAIILTGAGRGFSAGFDIARRPDGRSSPPEWRSPSTSIGGGRAIATRRSSSCTSGTSRSRSSPPSTAG